MCWQETVEQLVPQPGCIVHQAHLSLTPEPSNVGIARRFVSAESACEDDNCVEVMALLTSELVTNAVIHARTQLEVAVVMTRSRALVLVHDEDLGRKEESSDRDGGRGLGLVEALADSSGMTYHGRGGKTAWFTLAVPAHGHLSA